MATKAGEAIHSTAKKAKEKSARTMKNTANSIENKARLLKKKAAQAEEDAKS
jgi:hypothetical protein